MGTEFQSSVARISTTALLLVSDAKAQSLKDCQNEKFSFSVDVPGKGGSSGSGYLSTDAKHCLDVSVWYSSGTVMAFEASEIVWRHSPSDHALPRTAIELAPVRYGHAAPNHLIGPA